MNILLAIEVAKFSSKKDRTRKDLFREESSHKYFIVPINLFSLSFT